LEGASSLNSISAVFIQKQKQIHLSTSNKEMREQLINYYTNSTTLQKVHSINFHRSDFEQAYPETKARIFDTILILNAMENGIYDRRVIQNARHLLLERGRLILLAPIFTGFYNDVKISLEELRKYNLRSIRAILTNKMEILMTMYFTLVPNSWFDRYGPSVIIVARKI
jgi:hypothetical protein